MTFQFRVSHMVTKKNGMKVLEWSDIRAHTVEEATKKAQAKYGKDFRMVHAPVFNDGFGTYRESEHCRRCW